MEPFKDTAILAMLAQLRPADIFELFDAEECILIDPGPMPPNVIHRGILHNVSEVDFSSYDGFLFASLFEGLPNVVLEMSQHAIPMILAKVGGLPHTFDERAVFFVPTDGDVSESAKAFDRDCGRVHNLTPDKAVSMAVTARDQALARHSPEVFMQQVAALFGAP
jgi:glycosyltransferase involved in cell wall biosynthesis